MQCIPGSPPFLLEFRVLEMERRANISKTAIFDSLEKFGELQKHGQFYWWILYLSSGCGTFKVVALNCS